MLSSLLSSITKLFFLPSDTTANRLEAKHGLENTTYMQQNIGGSFALTAICAAARLGQSITH